MRVIISAGGTGGHIYPALAIINKIKEQEVSSEFLYIGTHNRMEKDIVPAHGIPFKSIEIYGFNKKKGLKNIKTVYLMLKSIKECKAIIKKFNPDIVIGVGGYVTVPVIYSAKKLGFTTFIHEQNSIPGKANLYLSKYADLIGVSFKSSMKHFPTYKTIFTGNPVGEDALKIKEANKSEFGLSNNKKLVLFVMGSLGSSKMNEFLLKTIKLLNNKEYEVLFVTGKEDYENIRKSTVPSNVKVVPYVENLARIMKRSNLIVSRAGASTLSEIIALKIPSILIPSPYVPNNHQYKNALSLVEKDAAILIEEKNLKGDILVRKIDSILYDESKILQMKRNLEELSVKNSATMIYESIKEKVDRK